ncbi:MAG: cell division FtsK/SpoIIIE [Herbinix sp.]|nr:cell division FtsK/SpoIIIE [Herbinix sp.]
MASTSTTKKSSNTKKKKQNKGKQRETIRESGVIQDEIILIITLVISILLFLSNINLCGVVGKLVSDFLFGMIGLEAYLLPIVLFFGTAFHISNMGNKTAGRKLISAIIFLVALSSLIQLISSEYNSKMMIFDYYTNSMKTHNGGGIIGGIFVMIFCGLFAPVATYIILIAIMLISLIVITGKALFTYIAKKSKASYANRKEYQRMKQEEMEEAILLPKVTAQEINQKRRPPKTFVLDPESSIDPVKANESKPVPKGKEQRATKLKDQTEELPSLNFDHLFDMEEVTAGNETQYEEPTIHGAVSTYEEELKNKFGNGELNDISANNDSTREEELPKSFIQEYPEQSEDIVKPHDVKSSYEDKHGQTHGVEDKPNKEKHHDTTNVEPMDIKQVVEEKEYIFPSTELLTKPKPKTKGMSERDLKETAIKLQKTLESFGVHVTITNVSVGPSVTRYELQPEQGVKVSRITSLADDIKLNLAAADVRIEAPIPGKAAVGIEVPNTENTMVTFRELLESKEFSAHPSSIAFAVGKDIGGQTIITDIAKMPHLLIAGATGSGKSVCINTLIMSIIYKAKPTDVRLIMVDPKVVELNVYNGIPHLLIPVVTDPKKASAALNWAVMEMTERYKKFADIGVRDLKGYNEKVAGVAYLKDENYQKLPQIVIIIDELADLMMVAPGEVEDAICRLAQLARACGIHLIIATQRPSVNVITGLIKANIPSRIAFSVSSAIDSRTILDGSGAEKLLGKGDMLFFPSGYPKPVRIQGAFVSDKEVNAVVDFLKDTNSEAQYSEEIKDKITNAKAMDGGAAQGSGNERDDYFIEAGKFIIDKDKASIGMLQRVYKIGFNRAARIMDQLAEAGVVGPEEGTKPRKILMSLEQFEQYVDEN